jgi:lipid II:glycine glycyltransferase (peptidoglycan interpeptide bridge formation enzyme)
LGGQFFVSTATGLWSLFTADDAQWDATMRALPHHSVYQSSRWAKHRSQFGWTPIRLVSRDASGNTISALQVLTKRAPGNSSIAWSAGGPAGDISHLDQSALLLLKQQLRARFTYLRVSCMRSTSAEAISHLRQNKLYQVKTPIGADASLILDISADESTRLERCSSNWKRNLKRSAKHGSVPFVWKNPVAKEIAAAYTTMDDYKKVSSGSITKNEDEIQSVLDCFGEDLVVIRCNDTDGSPLAIRAALVQGDQAWDFIAIATPEGRKHYSSHAVLWHMANECAARGVKRIDLGGIDPVKNKGVYDFKQGTGAEIIDYLGEWDISFPSWIRGLASRIISQRVQ